MPIAASSLANMRTSWKPLAKWGVAGAILGLVVTILTIAWWRSGQLDVVAKDSLESLLRGDPVAYYVRHSPDEELRSGLSERSFVEVYEQLVKPRMAKVRFSRSVTSKLLNSPPTEAEAYVEGKLPDGSTYNLSVLMWPTEVGPRAPVLWDLLTQAWTLDYAIAHPTDFRNQIMTSGDIKVLGLRHDRGVLESLGIKGLVTPKNTFLTWDELEAYWLEVGRKESLARRSQ